jgi:hypothetical protein
VSSDKSSTDWFSRILAFSALVVSAWTAYRTLVIQEDDIRVVIGKSPSYFLMTDGSLIVYGQPELTFINSGNRAAAITSIAAILSRLGSIEVQSPACAEKTGDYFPVELDIEPFVLKAGEIIVRTGGFPKRSFFEKKDGYYTLRVPFVEVKKGDAFLACLQLSITTPDSHSARTQLLAYKYETSTTFRRFNANSFGRNGTRRGLLNRYLWACPFRASFFTRTLRRTVTLSLMGSKGCERFNFFTMEIF